MRGIIADVATRGDRALVEFTNQFDRVDSTKSGSGSRRRDRAATAACDQRALDALALARDRIEVFHRRQLPKDDRFTDALGVELGSRWTAIESVGLYVPGGTAAYPSSVLMNARTGQSRRRAARRHGGAGAGREARAACVGGGQLAGVDEVYRIGGAQAVAALAYGTATIKPVVKIVGPGNAYVAAANRSSSARSAST